MKLDEAWTSLPGAQHIWEAMTVGGLVHSYFLSNFLKDGVYPRFTSAEESCLRRAMYGGRTEVFVRRPSNATDNIYYYDVNSLYPAVMESCDMPCGEPIWHFATACHPDIVPLTAGQDLSEFRGHNSKKRKNRERQIVAPVVHVNRDLTEIMEALNECKRTEVFGFVEVDVLCPQDLHLPVLPEKLRSLDSGYEKNMFTLTSKRRSVYFTDELIYACQRGYVVTAAHWYVKFKRTKLYQEFIEVMKEQKMKGDGVDVFGNRLMEPDGTPTPKNKSLRLAAKLAQNNEYGKTLQRVTEERVMLGASGNPRNAITRFFHADVYKNVRVTPLFRLPDGDGVRDVAEVKGERVKPLVEKRSSCGIGLAILAHARMMLYDYMESVQAVGGEVLYCDTDSIVYAGENPLPAEDIDDTAYGKMKLEIPVDQIRPGGFVALAPKCYAFDLVEGYYVKCKGVSVGPNVLSEGERRDEDKNIDVVRGMRFDNYVRMVESADVVLEAENFQMLKTHDLNMAACRVTKHISDRFDKRRIDPDSHVTQPWRESDWHLMRVAHVHDVEEDAGQQHAQEEEGGEPIALSTD